MRLSEEQGIKLYLGSIMTGEYLTEAVKPGWIAAAKNPSAIAAGIGGAFGFCVRDEDILQAYETGEISVNISRKLRLEIKEEEKVSLKDGVLRLIKEADRACF